MESGRDALRLRGVGQQVAGKLLDGEFIERQVLVERLDHPIAIRPHRAPGVDVITVGIGIARQVEPQPRHSLAVMRRREQPIHQIVVGLWTAIYFKRVHFGDRWWQPGQIQTQPPDQRCPIGFPGRRQLLSLQPGQDKGVDWIARPFFIFYRRRLRTHRLDIRPMPTLTRRNGWWLNPRRAGVRAAQGCFLNQSTNDGQHARCTGKNVHVKHGSSRPTPTRFRINR